MLQYSMQYFAALWLNAIFLNLIFPYTLFEAVNTKNKDRYSVEFLEYKQQFLKNDWPLNFIQGVSYHYLKSTWAFDYNLRSDKIFKLLAILIQYFWDNIFVAFGLIPFLIIIAPLNVNTHMLYIVEKTSSALQSNEYWMYD